MGQEFGQGRVDEVGDFVMSIDGYSCLFMRSFIEVLHIAKKYGALRRSIARFIEVSHVSLKYLNTS